MDWGNEEEDVSEVTVAQFDALMDQIVAQRNQCDILEAQAKEAAKLLGELEAKMLGLLSATNRSDWKSKAGTLYISAREYVSPPKDIEEKKKLFDYLNSKGVLFEYLTVNPQSLTAYFKAEREQAEERGEFGFKLPGCGDPYKKESLGFRKAR